MIGIDAAGEEGGGRGERGEGGKEEISERWLIGLGHDQVVIVIIIIRGYNLRVCVFYSKTRTLGVTQHPDGLLVGVCLCFDETRTPTHEALA